MAGKMKRHLLFWAFVGPLVFAFFVVVVMPFLWGIYYSFTARFAVVSVILINGIGFALALMVTQPLRSSNALRTVFFMPNLIGGLILGFVWQFIFIQVFSALADRSEE